MTLRAGGDGGAARGAACVPSRRRCRRDRRAGRAQRRAAADWILPGVAGRVLVAARREPPGVAVGDPGRVRRRPGTRAPVRVDPGLTLSPVRAGAARRPGRLASAREAPCTPCGINVSAYEGEIPKAALRPFAGGIRSRCCRWRTGRRCPRARSTKGSRTGRSRRTRGSATPCEPSDEGRELEFPRPTVAENAWFAVDAAVLGEADAFGIRDDIDALERRLAELEENLGVRIERKLRSLLGRGSRAT